MASRAPSPAWTRRVPGSALLLFFLTTTLLTFLAVELWNAYAMAATGSLTLLAAVLPLELIYVVYYARPVWACHIDTEVERVETAVLAALGSRASDRTTQRSGVLALCTGAVRIADPACSVGWAPAKSYADQSQARSGVDVFFVGESRDLKRLAALRDAVGSGLARIAAPP